MSIEVSNESGMDISEAELISVARFVIARMDVHPAAELSMVLVDSATMADLHVRWMDLPAPPTSCRSRWTNSSPVDALTPRSLDRRCSATSCCARPSRRIRRTRPGIRWPRTCPADRPRCVAPPRLRPCGAGRGEGDVRPAEQLLEEWYEDLRRIDREAALANAIRSCSARPVSSTERTDNSHPGVYSE